MNEHWGRWKLSSVCLAGLMALYAGLAIGAEGPGEKSVPPPVQEEEVRRPPEKPAEKPPELSKLLQGIVPYTASTSFEVEPSTGILAPYGNGVAQDTLIRGWQKHHLGPVNIAPYFEYDTIYRTNIYQTSTDKKWDFINVLNPGIRLEMPVAKTSKVSLGYLGNYFIYSRYSNNSHCDHNINADAAFNLSRLSIRVGNTLRLATEERTAQNAQQRPYAWESPYLSATYVFADRWKIEGNYQMDYLNFLRQVDRLDDRIYNTFGTSLFYKFWPKTSALLQYIAVMRDHPFNTINNNTVHTFLGGFNWDPTAKLSGTAKFGYTIADYDEELPSRGNAPNSWALSVQTLYRYSRYTNLALVAQRSIQEDADSANSAYINSGLILTLNHQFHYFQINSYLAISYYNNSYIVNNIDPGTGELKKRNDNIFSAGGGLSRPLTKWLRVRIDYIYYNRGSNFATFTFNEHKVLLGLQSSF
jgi:polysaccharide biosynthesis protein VpsM